MGMADKFGKEFEKQAEGERNESIVTRAGGLSPTLLHETLRNKPEIVGLTMNKIRDNEAMNARFTKLLITMHGEPGKDKLLQKWHDKELTPLDQQRLLETVEEFKMRSAMAESIAANLDTKMLQYAAQNSPLLQQALAGMNDNPEAIKIVMEDIWKKVMGSGADLRNVRIMVRSLGEVKESLDSPERRRAQEDLDRRLKKLKITRQEYENALVAGDPDASHRNLQALFERDAGAWKRLMNKMGSSTRKANDIYSLAHDPARGGLGAANQELENRIAEVGRVLAVTRLRDPEVRKMLMEASVGGTIDEDEGGPEVEPVKKIEDLGNHAKRLDEASLWLAFDRYASDPSKTPKMKALTRGGVALPAVPKGTAFNSLTPENKERYIESFYRGLKKRHDAYCDRLGMLGPPFKMRGRKILLEFRKALKDNLGNMPNTLSTAHVDEDDIDFE